MSELIFLFFGGEENEKSIFDLFPFFFSALDLFLASFPLMCLPHRSAALPRAAAYALILFVAAAFGGMRLEGEEEDGRGKRGDRKKAERGTRGEEKKGGCGQRRIFFFCSAFSPAGNLPSFCLCPRDFSFTLEIDLLFDGRKNR